MLQEVITPWGIIEEEVQPTAWGRFSFSGPETPKPNQGYNEINDWMNKHNRLQSIADGMLAVIEAPAKVEAARGWRDQVAVAVRQQFAFLGSTPSPHKAEVRHTVRSNYGKTVVYSRLFVDGIDCEQVIDKSAIYDRNSWRSGRTERSKIVVGEFGNRKTFPQNKHGSFNWRGIAEHLVNYADRKNAALRLAQKRQSNKETAVALAAELGLGDFTNMTITPSVDLDKPCYVKVKIERAMTADQSRQLAAALKAAGVL